jgi:CRP/FNR family transcriptional regulator, cyclic AMP receptor protein
MQNCLEMDKSQSCGPDSVAPFRILLEDAGIYPALVDRILRSCSVRDVPARTPIQQVAEDPGGLWCLAGGALAVELAPGSRDPQVSYFLLPPVWVGEGGVIANAPRSIGLSTTRRSDLLHLPAHRFVAIAKEEPLIWRWVAKVQKQNFERAMRMVDALMVRRSEARVSAVLLQLGGWTGPRADEPRILDITQDQLAAIANVSRSVLSPILQALSAKGTIELGHRTITIADPAALTRHR